MSYIEIDISTCVDSVNEYITNKHHDDNEFDIYFYVMYIDNETVRVYQHEYSLSENYIDHFCARVARIEDEIFKYLNEYIECHTVNEIIHLGVRVTKDDLVYSPFEKKSNSSCYYHNIDNDLHYVSVDVFEIV
jgi:hypothetical protein